MAARVRDLVLLVGFNPYPNYLTTLTLKPERVYFLYTEDSEPVRDRLQETLSRANYGIEAPAKAYGYISDPGSASAIRHAMRDVCRYLSDQNLISGACLSYTGGTKAMAVHAMQVWREELEEKAMAVYLDDRTGEVRFDRGDSEKVDLDVDLETLTFLHGKENPQYKRVDDPDSPSAAAFSVARVAVDWRRSGKWFGDKNNNYNDNNIDKWMEEVAKRVGPEGNKLAQNHRWLEVLTAACCELAGATRERVYLNVEWYRPGKTTRELELDVAVMIGHRLHVLSCTTSKNLDACKRKLFEAAMRARQLGGGLARYGLVCLHGDDDLVQLREDVHALWEGRNTPEIFGLNDVAAWAGVDTQRPDVSSLRQWLEIGR